MAAQRKATHLVPQRQLVLLQLHAPAQTLRDAEAVLGELARELEAHAAQARAALGVDPDARRELADDRAEVARLQPARRREGAAGRSDAYTMPRPSDTHLPCIGSEIQMTGWPDCLTAEM